MDEELGAIRLKQFDTLCLLALAPKAKVGMRTTFRDFHLCNGLPLVHCYKPRIALSPAAQIYDKLALVIAQRGKYSFQAVQREATVGK